MSIFSFSSKLGLTDDEAYYWALAQRPDWSYAYHPPMVAWLILLSQKSLGWCFGTHSSAIVRFPSSALSAGILALSLSWLKQLGVQRDAMGGVAFLLLSLAGIFALSWMMVPDLPLFMGLMLSFCGCWGILDHSKKNAHFSGKRAALMLFSGTLLAILSKYSGVLIALSAGASLLLWVKDSRLRSLGLLSVASGVILALIPIMIWNARHDWASILYQIHDRHSGAQISMRRYLRFWLIEALIAGPCLLFYAAVEAREGISAIFRNRESHPPSAAAYCWVWALPALLVFCSQPLWADFKPHWALIGWWPLMLAFGSGFGKEGAYARLAKTQRTYGLILGALVLLACCLPVGDWALSATLGPAFDPRLDVTNDLFGWDQLSPYLRSQNLDLPLVASRYQIAGQAYFALGPGSRVTLLPRETKDRDEWPSLFVSKSEGPGWPELTKEILFVTDIRYDASPSFPGAQCLKLHRLEAKRGGYLAKWIELWRCKPPQSLISSIR